MESLIEEAIKFRRKGLDLRSLYLMDLNSLSAFLQIEDMTVEILYANQNKISSIPKWFPEIPWQELYFDANQLDSFEGCFPNLIVLTLDNNRLKDFESACPKLESLSLADNLIKSFDGNGFPKLRSLSLCGNRSVKFSNHGMNNLVTLNLSSTFIETIPCDLLMHSPLLTYLNISNNQIDSIPLDFWRQGRHLKNVSCHQNPCMVLKDYEFPAPYITFESSSSTVLSLLEIAEKCLGDSIDSAKIPINLSSAGKRCYMCGKFVKCGHRVIVYFLAGEDSKYLKHHFHLCQSHYHKYMDLNLSEEWAKSASSQGLLS